MGIFTSSMSWVEKAGWHEAGHAAVWHALGGPIKSIEIGRRCATTRLKERFIAGPHLSRKEHDILVTMGGPLMEALHRGISFDKALREGSGGGQVGSDLWILEGILYYYKYDKWIKRTKQVLQGYKHDEIRDLAEALMAKKKLNGSEVARTLNGNR